MISDDYYLSFRVSVAPATVLCHTGLTDPMRDFAQAVWHVLSARLPMAGFFSSFTRQRHVPPGDRQSPAAQPGTTHLSLRPSELSLSDCLRQLRDLDILLPPLSGFLFAHSHLI